VESHEKKVNEGWGQKKTSKREVNARRWGENGGTYISGETRERSPETGLVGGKKAQESAELGVWGGEEKRVGKHALVSKVRRS